MMCRDGDVMGHMSNLASDEGDGWLMWRHPWLSVPLTVRFILSLDHVFVSLWYLCFVFTTLLLRDLSDLGDYSVDLRITNLTVLVIILSSADKNFTYWSDVQDPIRSPGREERSTRYLIWYWFISIQTMHFIRLNILHKIVNWHTNTNW